ncbi:hypothetical protein HMPREF3224_01421, partial [Anaerococcus hydrogenalis]
ISIHLMLAINKIGLLYIFTMYIYFNTSNVSNQPKDGGALPVEIIEFQYI